MPRPIIFDSDGGVDDAAALWWACTSPDVEVVAVTAVAGNVDVDQAAINLATILAAAGHGHVPVAVGTGTAVGPVLPMDRPKGIHGADGLGDAGIPRVAYTPPAETAPVMLTRLVAERPGQLTVVATGPLSNLALALRRDREWSRRLADLIVMGGAARPPGNVSALAEANIAHDPQAAAEVMGADWVAPPLMVGLDVSMRATLTEVEFAVLKEHRTDAARFLDAPLAFYRPIGGRFNAPGECPCHDLLAMMAVSDSGLLGTQLLPVEVDTGGSAAWGATVVDFRPTSAPERGKGGRWRIGLEVDIDRFRANVRTLFGKGPDDPG
jgi:purine nucleosidase